MVLQEMIAILPGHVYWYDKSGIIYGCNDQQARSLGFASAKELVGKNAFAIVSDRDAEVLKKNNDYVIEGKEIITSEEPITYSDGRTGTVLSTKAPWIDKKGNSVGVIGVSLDITEQKKLESELDKAKKSAEFKFNLILNLLPVHIYLTDKNNVFIWCNDAQAKSLNLGSPLDFVGKTNFDFMPKEQAEKVNALNHEVIETGQPHIAEEIAKYPDGTQRVFLSQKAPLYDESFEVIGTVGTSIDITDTKEREQLQVEMGVSKKLLEAREKFKHTAQQVAHDINSPLGGLMMVIANIDPKKPMSELDRLHIQEALNEIRIVADELVNYDKIEADPDTYKKDRPLSVPISVALSQFLAVKQSEYKSLPLRLSAEISKSAYAAFIKIEPTALKRSLSNIINNARDAFDGKAGEIALKLEATKTHVQISIEDNGKGMPVEVVHKIMNKIAVSSDKAEGHGFGMVQVSEALARNRGTLNIESALAQGTKVILTFPRIETAFWFAEQIMIGARDIIVVLDDDAAMHYGWDACLKETIAACSEIQLVHFYDGVQAVDFINNASVEDQQRMLLLTDYELSEQALNGLDVVQQAKAMRAFLVTSHYEDPDIQGRAIDLGVKIIPKQSATMIPIRVDNSFNYNAVTEALERGPLKNVDIIVIDDNEAFAQLLVLNFEGIGKVAEAYSDPRKLLKEVTQYRKDTRICMDNDLGGGGHMNGIELAKALHALGYSQLYLLSGSVFAPGELPDYLTALVKSDADFVRRIFDDGVA